MAFSVTENIPNTVSLPEKKVILSSNIIEKRLEYKWPRVVIFAYFGFKTLIGIHNTVLVSSGSQITRKESAVTRFKNNGIDLDTAASKGVQGNLTLRSKRDD